MNFLAKTAVPIPPLASFPGLLLPGFNIEKGKEGYPSTTPHSLICQLQEVHVMHVTEWTQKPWLQYWFSSTARNNTAT